MYYVRRCVGTYVRMYVFMYVYNNIYLLQLGFHPVAVVILHVNKT